MNLSEVINTESSPLCVGSKPPTPLLENDASIDNKNRKKKKRNRKRKEEKASTIVPVDMGLCVALYA